MESKYRTARTLVKRLSSASENDEFEPDSHSLAEILSEIRRLTKHDPEIRAPLADAGAVRILARHLAHEDASAALLNLSISSRESLMSTPGLLDALALALRSSSHPSHAAATLYSLLSVDAYRPIIGSKRTILTGLLSLLPSPSAKDALKALFALALYPLNRSTMVDLGAAPPLFALIRGNRFLSDATAVVAQLSGCYESVDAFRRVAGVRVLVDLVDAGGGVSQRATENAAAALLNLAMFGGDRAVGDIREVDGAEAVVAELAERGSERGKEKAEALLRILVSGRASLLRRMDDFDHPSPPCSASSVDTTTTY